VSYVARKKQKIGWGILTSFLASIAAKIIRLES